MTQLEHETYVSLENAKLLKQAGFDWGCYTFYGLDVRYRGESIDEDEEYELKARGKKSEIEYVQGGRFYSGFYHSNKKGEDYNGYSAPTLAVAQKWLREVKNISVDIFSTRYSEWEYIIRKINQLNYKDNTILALTACKFYTYEEALEAGIKEYLKEKMFICSPECSED